MRKKGAHIHRKELRKKIRDRDGCCLACGSTGKQILGTIGAAYMKLVRQQDPNAKFVSKDSNGMVYIMGGVRQVVTWEEVHADVRIAEAEDSR